MRLFMVGYYDRDMVCWRVIEGLCVNSSMGTGIDVR